MENSTSPWVEKSDRIIVTGGCGFLGGYVLEELINRGYSSILVPRSAVWDLREGGDCHALLYQEKPKVIIHLAAKVGGIGANREKPAEFFYDNLIMGAQLLHFAWQLKIKKFVAVGTICCYPKITPIPFKEEDLWNGFPEETNAPYGIAKRALLTQCQAYRQQYGFNAIYLLPTNLYGKREHFDLKTSHVIPALIRKFDMAIYDGNKKVVLWGDGSPTREFLYAGDCARGIVDAMEKYDKSEPVNLGSGIEISIRNLAEMIAEMMGFAGVIEWDIDMPNGQPRRLIDTTKAETEFGFKAQKPFEEGLREMIEWYKLNRESIEISLAKRAGFHNLP